MAPYSCVALLDTGSPQTFIRRDVLDRMLSVGAASAACERPATLALGEVSANLPLCGPRLASV